MADEGKLKSAYELAMERLRAEDEATGVEAPRPLTQKQKDKIAQLRQENRAKLAELEIMHAEKLAEAGAEPAKIQELEEHHQIDRERLASALESAIARVKSN